jgi:hypothetical protein
MSQVKAGSAYVELTTNNSKLMRGLADAQKRLQSFGAATRMLGTKVFAVGAGIATPILASAKIFSDVGDQIQKMALRTGVSTEALSTLGFAAEQSGADLVSLEKGLLRMQRTVADAASGNQGAIESLAELGLTASQLSSMTPDEQFKTIAEAIKGIEDPALRTAAAMKVFGKGGAALMPFLREGRAGIQALQDEAKSLGLELNLEDANSAAELNDALNRLTRSLKAIPMVIGAAVAPALNSLLKPITKIVVTGAQWINKNRALVVTLAKVGIALATAGALVIALGSGLAATGLALGGLASILGLASGMIAMVGGVIGALLSPIGLVSLAVVGLGAYLLKSSGLGAQALQWLGQRFETLRGEVSASLGVIGQALAAGDIAGAANVLWLTLKLQWLKGISALTGYWVAFRDQMWAITDALVYGTARLLSSGWAGIETAWVETIGFLADAWSLFTGTLTKSWHTTVGFIKKAWVRLKGLFDSDINVDAEVQRIDAETAGKNQAASTQMNEAIAQRDAERRAQRDQIEADRQGRSGTLDQMQAEVAAGRDGSGDAQIAQAAADLDAAKAQWKEAIDTLANTKPEPAGPSGSSIDDFKRTLANSGQTVAAEKQAIENKSTFNAFAIRGLGADSLSDRQLRAAEQTASNTRKLIKVVEESGLTYQ